MNEPGFRILAGLPAVTPSCSVTPRWKFPTHDLGVPGWNWTTIPSRPSPRLLRWSMVGLAVLSACSGHEQVSPSRMAGDDREQPFDVRGADLIVERSATTTRPVYRIGGRTTLDLNDVRASLAVLGPPESRPSDTYRLARNDGEPIRVEGGVPLFPTSRTVTIAAALDVDSAVIDDLLLVAWCNPIASVPSGGTPRPAFVRARLVTLDGRAEVLVPLPIITGRELNGFVCSMPPPPRWFLYLTAVEGSACPTVELSLRNVEWVDPVRLGTITLGTADGGPGLVVDMVSREFNQLWRAHNVPPAEEVVVAVGSEVVFGCTMAVVAGLQRRGYSKLGFPAWALISTLEGELRPEFERLGLKP